MPYLDQWWEKRVEVHAKVQLQLDVVIAVLLLKTREVLVQNPERIWFGFF